MADKKITDLPIADAVEDADVLVVVQGGVTKQATAAMVRAGTSPPPPPPPVNPPATPTNATPAAGAVDTSVTPTLQGSAYSHPDGTAQAAAEFRVSASTDFTTPLYTSGTLGAVTSHAIPGGTLTDSTSYHWQVRYRDAAGTWSAWSTATSFTTAAAVVAPTPPTTPTHVYPAAGAADVALPVTLESSLYSHLDGTVQAASQWQVSTSTDFTAPLYDSGEVIDTISHTVPAGTLADATAHYWRVRHKDTGGLWSGWSTATLFTTANASIQPDVGAAYQGGFYVGDILDDGNKYALILAPRASGFHASLQYKTAQTAAPMETRTLTNGPAATAAMVAAGAATYPAAAFCAALDIGGYTDWYLPARDEFELCWRNLKPTTETNDTSTRAMVSGVTYDRDGNTDDVAGDKHGRNRHSVPAGPDNTATVPGQTAVLAFRAGGAEAMTQGGVNAYWTASEADSGGAWSSLYLDAGSGMGGHQRRDPKTTSFMARAFRRVLAAW